MELVRLEPPLTNTLLRFSIVKVGVFSARCGVWDEGPFVCVLGVWDGGAVRIFIQNIYMMTLLVLIVKFHKGLGLS